MEYLKKATEFLSKYRWAVLILLLGVVLMLIPTSSEPKQTPLEAVTITQEDLGTQLSEILSQIKGVGKVQVLLTVDTGSSTVYQTDGEDTVIVTDENRVQSGLVQWVRSPAYRGAVVVCQGADSPTVRLSIVEAVSRVTGLSSDKITVLKMK